MDQPTEQTLPTVDTAKQLGLNAEEFDKIKAIMGRTPNFTELSIFSVMWSEHCSYKNSIKYIKKLPREGAHLLVEAGEENAGLVDIGDGYACAFKIESHNHPSAIEPYQGAATGVGGIHRDIFTMGARPIAALNSLRFGDPSTDRTQWLMRGVISGIGDYGNCLGVPTIGGETYFDPCYEQNILVNAMSIGVLHPSDPTVSATAEGVGNPVFIVGSATGKDGIHGATFASADLTESSADDIPAVQVGDPFQEKLLLEATLEAIRTDAIVGMQDMGAAGITCSTSEMSAKGRVGMRIDLDKVPTRQENMLPFEILLSESQERMLIVCKKGQEEILQAVFDKWELSCAIIGEVTDTQRLEFYAHGALVADVPADDLVLGGGAPVYDRPYSKPSYLDDQRDVHIDTIEAPTDIVRIARQVATSPNVVNKRWIHDQYDGTVRANSMTNNRPADAAVIRLKGTSKGIAATVDCNARYVHLDPYRGGAIAVSEAARNLVCTGAKPLAITNCLNFGNPYDEGVYYQFVHALRGMGDACEQFDTPVTGGNVSFYNQTVIADTATPVYPTPTIGMIGLLPDVDKLMTLDFKGVGDRILLVGAPDGEINGSIYAQDLLKLTQSTAPKIDLDLEFRHQHYLLRLIDEMRIRSAHDVSDGGLFVALLESAMHGDLGIKVTNDSSIRLDAWLFGEQQGRYLLSVTTAQLASVMQIAEELGVTVTDIGEVTADHEIQIEEIRFGAVSQWKHEYDTTLENIIENG